MSSHYVILLWRKGWKLFILALIYFSGNLVEGIDILRFLPHYCNRFGLWKWKTPFYVGKECNSVFLLNQAKLDCLLHWMFFFLILGLVTERHRVVAIIEVCENGQLAQECLKWLACPQALFHLPWQSHQRKKISRWFQEIASSFLRFWKASRLWKVAGGRRIMNINQHLYTLISKMLLLGYTSLMMW